MSWSGNAYMPVHFRALTNDFAVIIIITAIVVVLITITVNILRLRDAVVFAKVGQDCTDNDNKTL